MPFEFVAVQWRVNVVIPYADTQLLVLQLDVIKALDGRRRSGTTAAQSPISAHVLPHKDDRDGGLWPPPLLLNSPSCRVYRVWQASVSVSSWRLAVQDTVDLRVRPRRLGHKRPLRQDHRTLSVTDLCNRLGLERTQVIHPPRIHLQAVQRAR